jgi:peptide methionine sulfoxide reductase MsrA
MHCYWEGEVKLGGIAGVRETSAGWIGGKEVVNVAFNPKVVSYEKLLKTAQSMQCASTVFAHNARQKTTAKKLVRDVVDLPSASRQRPVRYTEQKYHLRRTALKYLPLTPIQLAKVNSAVYARKDYRQYLSPRQIELDKKINKALRADPKKLQGLAAPDAARDLQAYSKKLMARLE